MIIRGSDPIGRATDVNLDGAVRNAAAHNLIASGSEDPAASQGVFHGSLE